MTIKNEIKFTSIKHELEALAKKKPRIILYSRDKNKFGVWLEKTIERVVSKERVEPCRTIPDLTLRLRMPLYESTIAVLLISDDHDLRDMISLQSLLANLRIILILHNRNGNTIETGHGLHPRYLGFTDNNPRDIEAVLNRMVEIEMTSQGKK